MKKYTYIFILTAAICSLGLVYTAHALTLSSSLGVDTDVSAGDDNGAKADTSLDVKAENNSSALGGEETSLPPKTSGYLRGVMNTAITSLSNVSGNSAEETCTSLNNLYDSFSDDERASLAWGAGSYSSSSENPGGLSGAQADLFASAKSSFATITSELENLNPKSDSLGDKATLSRTRAIVRSAFIDLLNESKNEAGPDGSRLSRLSSLIDTGIVCLKASVAGDDSSAKSIAKIAESVGAVEKSITDNKGAFVTSDTDEEILVSQGDSGDEKDLSESSQVKNSADLKLFASTLLKHDSLIKQIAISKENIGVDYKTHGRFLGFIPVSITAKTEINADGEVSVRYPWYGFLVYKKSKITDDALKTEVLAELGMKEGDGIISLDSTASARAKIVNALSMASQKLSGSVSADVSATASQ